MYIKTWDKFISEEIINVSYGGNNKVYYDIKDEPSSAKSPSAGILLKDDLHKRELKQVIWHLRKELKYIPLKDIGIRRLIQINNLKFLKDMIASGGLLAMLSLARIKLE